MTTINSQEDFLRALSENPEWRAAVRAQILDSELLELPAQLNSFIERMDSFVSRVDSFIAAQEQINAEQRQFNAEQRQFNAEMREFRSAQMQFNTRIEVRMDRMNDDLGIAKGFYAQSIVVADAAGIAGDMGLTYIRTLALGDLAAMVSNSGLPVNVRRSFRYADLIFEASDDSGVLYVAMEMSYTADRRDTDRALRNAGILTEFTGRPARAAIASVKNDRETQELVDSGDVYWHPLPDRPIFGGPDYAEQKYYAERE